MRNISKKYILALVGLMILMTSVASAAPVTLTFAGLPGPDNQLGTGDDVAFTSNDILFTCGPAGCGARIIDNEYAGLGVAFSGAAAIGAIGGGFNPDGTPDTSGLNLLLENIVITDEATGATGGIAPTTVTFDLPQTEITFDLFAFINASGTGQPIKLVDVDGNVIATRVLTNADAILGGTNPHQLFGRFSVMSAVPFKSIAFGLTQPSNGGYGIDNLTFEAPPRETQVSLDIKPGSFPNSINVRSKGVLPVAILTTSSFDAATVDPRAIRFGPAEAAPLRWSLADVDRDGDLDLVLHFRTTSTGINCSHTSAKLIGKTFDGKDIVGSDSVRPVGCKK